MRRGVLRDEDHDLQEQTDAQTQDQQVQAGGQVRGSHAQGGQQVQAKGGQRRPGYWVSLIVAGPGDEPAGGDGGDQEPADQRQEQQPEPVALTPVTICR